MQVKIAGTRLPPNTKAFDEFLIDPEEITDFSYYVMAPIITMKDGTRYWINTPLDLENASKESPIIKEYYDNYVGQLDNVDPELIADNVYPQLEPKYKGPAPYPFLESEALKELLINFDDSNDI